MDWTIFIGISVFVIGICVLCAFFSSRSVRERPRARTLSRELSTDSTIGELPHFDSEVHGGSFTGGSFASTGSFDDVTSFYSAYGDDLERALALEKPPGRTNSYVPTFAPSFPKGERASAVPLVTRSKRPPQNSNQVSQYHWLQELLQSIVESKARESVWANDSHLMKGSPLFVVAGACPNHFCGMQAVLFCQVKDSIDFWWVKPMSKDPARLERKTLNRNSEGNFKNTAETSKKLYSPLVQTFLGKNHGDFSFGVDDSGRAYFDEQESSLSNGGAAKRRMFIHLVWQEAWSSPWARRSSKFIEGKLFYSKEATAEGASGGSRYYARQYRIEGQRILIVPGADEEPVASILPPDSSQYMYDMPEKAAWTPCLVH